MIGYITLGTADIKRGAAFYDAIAKEMDTSRLRVKRRLKYVHICTDYFS